MFEIANLRLGERVTTETQRVCQAVCECPVNVEAINWNRSEPLCDFLHQSSEALM